MLHLNLQSSEALVFAPLVLGCVGITICIVVMEIVRWIGSDRPERLPAARILERR